MGTWNALPAWVLIATGVCKAVATPLCLNFGWHGGHFFPCIFIGVTCGYGIAALTGADPVFCVVVTCGVFVAGVVRKPLLVVGLLLLCFPLEGIAWLPSTWVPMFRCPGPFAASGRFCARFLINVTYASTWSMTASVIVPLPNLATRSHPEASHSLWDSSRPCSPRPSERGGAWALSPRQSRRPLLFQGLEGRLRDLHAAAKVGGKLSSVHPPPPAHVLEGGEVALFPSVSSTEAPFGSEKAGSPTMIGHVLS